MVGSWLSQPPLEWRLGYRPHLDGLRAVAMVAVLVDHAQLIRGGGGAVGVTSFFVLSGYLITSLLLQEIADSGAIRLRAFYFRRAIRLLPALLIVCVASAAVLAIQGELRRGIETSLAGLAYISSWLVAGGTNLGPIGHTWSLSVEEHFYVTWPLLFLVLAARGRGRLALTLVAAAVLVTVWRTFALLEGWPPVRIGMGIDMQADGLLVGCALALVADRVRVPRLALAGGLLMLAALTVAPMMVITWPFTILAAAAVILGGTQHSDRLLGPALVHPVTRHLGRISYGIYLWHYPVMWFSGVINGPFTLSLALVTIATAIGLAELSYWLVERPLLSWSRNRRGHAQQSQPAKIGMDDRLVADPVN